MKDDLKKVLYKKAKGYKEREITEEFADGDDGLKMTKRKVVYKNIAPDLSAIKLIAESERSELASLSDEELEREKERLLGELAVGGGGRKRGAKK